MPPSTVMMAPLTTPSQLSTDSPANELDRVSARPSTKTPPVWVAVTVAPTTKASRDDPCRPAMYAAITVLPCPGKSACDAPRIIASVTANRPTPSVRSRRPTNSLKRSVTWSTTPESGPPLNIEVPPDGLSSFVGRMAGATSGAPPGAVDTIN